MYYFDVTRPVTCHNFFQQDIGSDLTSISKKLSECVKQNKVKSFRNKPVDSASLQSIVFLQGNFAPEAFQHTDFS